jgi:hypothetical protein
MEYTWTWASTNTVMFFFPYSIQASKANGMIRAVLFSVQNEGICVDVHVCDAFLHSVGIHVY